MYVWLYDLIRTYDMPVLCMYIWYLGALRYGYENARYVLKSTYVLILSVRTSQL